MLPQNPASQHPLELYLQLPVPVPGGQEIYVVLLTPNVYSCNLFIIISDVTIFYKFIHVFSAYRILLGSIMLLYD